MCAFTTGASRRNTGLFSQRCVSTVDSDVNLYTCLPINSFTFSNYNGLINPFSFLFTVRWSIDHLHPSILVHLYGSSCVSVRVSVCVYECPERNVWPPHMRAFNGPVGVAFNSSGDDNCGAM